MKTLLLFLAAAGLAGCATYPAHDYDGDTGQAYVQHPAPFIYDRAGLHRDTLIMDDTNSPLPTLDSTRLLAQVAQPRAGQMGRSEWKIGL